MKKWINDNKEELILIIWTLLCFFIGYISALLKVVEYK